MLLEVARETAQLVQSRASYQQTAQLVQSRASYQQTAQRIKSRASYQQIAQLVHTRFFCAQKILCYIVAILLSTEAAAWLCARRAL